MHILRFNASRVINDDIVAKFAIKARSDDFTSSRYIDRVVVLAIDIISRMHGGSRRERVNADTEARGNAVRGDGPNRRRNAAQVFSFLYFDFGLVQIVEKRINIAN
ncbi:hypothetical protein D3C85_1331600 [compost metagenome]